MLLGPAPRRMCRKQTLTSRALVSRAACRRRRGRTDPAMSRPPLAALERGVDQENVTGRHVGRLTRRIGD